MNPTLAACVGNCDLGRRVTASELVLGVQIALGLVPLRACTAFDPNMDGLVEVDELVQAVTNAVYGCGVIPPTRTWTPTATVTPTRTVTPTATNTKTPTETFTATATVPATATDTPTPPATATPTDTTTVTPTATRTGTPAPCPWQFNQVVNNAAMACGYVGVINDQCGGVWAGTWLSDSRLIVGAVTTAGIDFNIYWGARVVNGTQANLVGWALQPNFSDLTAQSGSMMLANGRAVFEILPDQIPFSAGRCPFRGFIGVFAGLLGNAASGAVLLQSPSLSPELLANFGRTVDEAPSERQR